VISSTAGLIRRQSKALKQNSQTKMTGALVEPFRGYKCGFGTFKLSRKEATAGALAVPLGY